MTQVLGDKSFWWLFEAAAVPMFLADSGGAILARNASCERLFGYGAEEWAGLTVEDLIPQRSRVAHRHFRAAYAADPVPRGMGRSGAFSGLRKDGSEFQARVSLSPAPGVEGPAVLAIIEDVTAQCHAENALREREVQLGLAVRVNGLASWEWNVGTGVAYLSPEWKAQLGYADEQLSSDIDEWCSRVHPDDVSHLQAMLEDFRSGSRDETEIQYRLRHRDGSYRWMQSRAVALPPHTAGELRLLGMQWDVTDQVAAAQQLSEWRHEVESQRQWQVALETAAAIIHELNQPLNAVMSFCEAAQSLAREGDEAKLDYALKGAIAQAARASQVVRDLLQFLERRQTPTEAVDLNRIATEAVRLVEGDGDPGLRVRLILAPQLPSVRANEVQLKKVLTNLLRNGAEAMAAAGIEGNRLTVTVRTADEGGMALASVKDSGPGLDPATIERIFEPFFTTKPRGIGMGLATSRRIIERFGGRLWFEAGADGATFHFTVPFAP